jgi:hypothetical protein
MREVRFIELRPLEMNFLGKNFRAGHIKLL